MQQRSATVWFAVLASACADVGNGAHPDAGGSRMAPTGSPAEFDCHVVEVAAGLPVTFTWPDVTMTWDGKPLDIDVDEGHLPNTVDVYPLLLSASDAEQSCLDGLVSSEMDWDGIGKSYARAEWQATEVTVPAEAFPPAGGAAEVLLRATSTINGALVDYALVLPVVGPASSTVEF
jgi:hypothetical protein